MSRTIQASLLFRAADHACCDCCMGYCPSDDIAEKDRWDALFTFMAGGVEYLGDRRLMLRREVLTGIPEDVPTIKTSIVDPDFAKVPTKKPPVFTGKHSALHFDRLDLAGLECRGTAGEKVVHVFAGGEHIGWTTVANPDAKSAIHGNQLDRVRRIAIAACIDLNAAALALTAVEATS